MDFGQLLAPDPPEPPDPPDVIYCISIRSFPSPTYPDLCLQPKVLIIQGIEVYSLATPRHLVVSCSTLFRGSRFILLWFWICFAFQFKSSPSIHRRILTIPTSTVKPPTTPLSSHPSVESNGDEDCLANHQSDISHQMGSMVVLAMSWPSSLNKVSSTSSVDGKTLLLYASKYHPTSFESLRVRYQLCSYSPLILHLDVYVNMLVLGLDLCSYSSIILDSDVCDTFSLGLLSDCSWKISHVSNYAYKPTIRSLLPCPPWSYSCYILLGLGLEVLFTDDQLSVSFKGSTLFSAAEFKIVKLALTATSITEISSVAVILTFDCVILLLRCDVVEIQGRLYIICCLCLVTALILCFSVLPTVGSSECILFDFASIILCKQSSFVGV